MLGPGGERTRGVWETARPPRAAGLIDRLVVRSV